MEHALRDRRPTHGRRPDRGSGAQNAILLVGLAVVGLVAVSILLPKGPLTASATSAPQGSQAGTQAAVGTEPASAPVVAPSHTNGLITLPPSTAGPTPGPVSSPDPVATEAPATAAPGPTPTRAPTATPRVTQKPPSPAPTRTATPTAGPTAANTATILVKVITVLDDGGVATPSSFTVTVNSAGFESPASFAGSATGTSVTISSGQSYTISTSGPAGYGTIRSSDCTSATGGLPVAGASETCTITRNDVAPAVRVVVDVNGGGPESPADWTVSVSAAGATPSSFAGSTTGTTTRFDAGVPFSITISNPAGGDYDQSQSGPCSGSGLPLDGGGTCTFTLTYDPPATDPPPTDPPPTDPPATDPPPPAPLQGSLLLLPAIAAAYRGRAWRPTAKRG